MEKKLSLQKKKYNNQARAMTQARAMLLLDKFHDVSKVEVAKPARIR
jgi:hypothetical protein